VDFEKEAVNFIEFLNAHFVWVFLAFFVLMVVRIGTNGYRRWREDQRNPPPPESAALFEERSASGFSRKDFFTRIGGGSSALVVRVTNELLIIEPLPILKWVNPKGFNDLEHRIPRSKIAKIERTEGLLHKSVAIDFALDDGTTRTVELRLKNLDEFIRVLGGSTAKS